MTYQRENPPVTTPTGSPQSQVKTRPPHSTATGRLLALLERQEWVCGQEMAEVAGFRYGGRLHELRHTFGWVFDRRKCQHPWHNHLYNEMFQWTIAARPGEPVPLLGMSG